MASFPDAPPDLITFADIKWHVRRALRFGLVSGAGLALDLSFFLTLVAAGVRPFAANIVSSGTALTFVYLASVRRIFRYDGRFIVPLFAAFVCYHVCGTVLVSGLISQLVHLGVAPALAKVGILPATFGANYLFMSWLTASRERWLLRSERAPD